MKKSPSSNQSKAKQGQSKLRIIGGEWRSRMLPILEVEGLRPTTDRVRETVFNWLNFDVPGALCLDLFCGSGALGFESLSRGAKECTFVELNKAVAQQTRQNLVTLKANNGSVTHGDALTFLQGAAVPYDIIFLDPPFRKGLLNQVIPLLDNGWVKTNSLIYIERESETPLTNLPIHWQLKKEKQAGQLTFALYQVTQ